VKRYLNINQPPLFIELSHRKGVFNYENLYGKVRLCTSTSVEQNEDRQVLALLKMGIRRENLYIDKQSGKDFERENYKRLVSRLKVGDLVYVHSIDRLGRNYEEILNQWRIITKEIHADITVIDMPILDTRLHRDLLGTFIADLILQVLSYVAHSERDNIRKRQAEGIAAAKMRGVRFGRPNKELPANFGALVRRWEQGEVKMANVLKLCGISRSTFYVKLQEHRNSNKKMGNKVSEKSNLFGQL